MRWPRFRWRTLAVLLLLLPGCVQLTGQRITWFYDQAKDELQILIHYDGIHDSGNANDGEKGAQQIPRFVQEGNVMILDWPLQLETIRKAAEENGAGPLQKDWAQLFQSLKVEAVGYYREPDGRVGAVQRITVPRASEFVAQANRLVSRTILAKWPAADRTEGRTLQRICDAAEKGHDWIRLDGQSIRIDVPIQADEWAVFKAGGLDSVARWVASALGHTATGADNPAYSWNLQGLTSVPISYLEQGDRLEFVLGRVKTPGTWRYRIRSDFTYEPSLEKVVAESIKTDIDQQAAEALLQPKATASDPIRALLDWGPPEDRVRALMSAAEGGDAARKKAAVALLDGWGRRWNEQHGVPQAPAMEGGSYDSTAWKKWYASMRRYPVFLGEETPSAPPGPQKK